MGRGAVLSGPRDPRRCRALEPNRYLVVHSREERKHLESSLQIYTLRQVPNERVKFLRIRGVPRSTGGLIVLAAGGNGVHQRPVPVRSGRYTSQMARMVRDVRIMGWMDMSKPATWQKQYRIWRTRCIHEAKLAITLSTRNSRSTTTKVRNHY